jgi:hypothetical protein
VLVVDACVIVEATLQRLETEAMDTLDGPLWRRTNQLGFVVTPAELKPTSPKETSR